MQEPVGTYRNCEDGVVNLSDGCDRLLTKREFATHLGVSLRSVDNYLADGLPHIKLGERTVRIEFRDAMDWVRNRFRIRRN